MFLKDKEDSINRADYGDRDSGGVSFTVAGSEKKLLQYWDIESSNPSVKEQILNEMRGVLKFPIARFDETPPHEEAYHVNRSTPYGVLPEWVLGSDGKLYIFTNQYFFDAEGNAKKLELIEEVEESFDRWFGEDKRSEFPVLDFVPDPLKSQLVDLDVHDYEKLHGLLKKIEQGELVP